MSYNAKRPADTDLIKESAKLIRENLESLRKDGIVFAKPPLYGAGEPKASAGEKGDRYIDTVNGNHYYKNNAGQWELNLSLNDKYKTIKDVKTIVEKLQAMIVATEQKNGETNTALKTLKDSGTVHNSKHFGLKEPDYYRCANGCSWTCSSECSGACSAGCDGGCVSCTATCSGACSATCTGSCMSTCKGTCVGGCSKSCFSGCSGGCSGRD